MKIGISASSLEKSLNNGIVDGIGHYTMQVYQGIEDRGNKAVPFAFPRTFRKAEFLNSTPFPRSYAGQFLSTEFGFCRPFSPSVDVFHVTDFKSIPLDVPVISTIWDAIPFVHPEWMRAGLGRHLAPILFKKSVQYADHIVCTSEHAAKDVSKYYEVPEHKISIVPWCISDHWKCPVSDLSIAKVLKKYQIERSYVLSVGTLQPRKNFDRLIDAFLKVEKDLKTKEVLLVIVGKEGWGCETLIKKINANKGKVLHLNSVQDEDLRKIYRGASAVVFPSLYEGFGMPALESFASSVPLVAANATSIPEVTGDAALLFDPLSVDSISKALSDVLINDDVAVELVKKGAERLKLFSEDAMIDQLLKLYNKARNG